MGRKTKLRRNTNFLSSVAPESVPHCNSTTRPLYDDDDDHSILSNRLKIRNANSGAQTGQGEKQSTIQTDENQQIRVPNTKVLYEIVPGFRYSSNVLYCPQEQQFYLANSASEIGVGYTCYVSDCKCRMHLRNNECYVGNAIAHNHETKTQMYDNLCALNEIKRILRLTDNQLPIKQVFDDVVER